MCLVEPAGQPEHAGRAVHGPVHQHDERRAGRARLVRPDHCTRTIRTTSAAAPLERSGAPAMTTTVSPLRDHAGGDGPLDGEPHHVVGGVGLVHRQRLHPPRQGERGQRGRVRRQRHQSGRRPVAGHRPRRAPGAGAAQDGRGLDVVGGLPGGVGDRLGDALAQVGRTGPLHPPEALGPLPVRRLGFGSLGDARHRGRHHGRVVADRGLPRQHDGVGPVEDGVGDVAHLGTGGQRGVDHRFEHLRRRHHRLADLDAVADDLLLQVRHVLERTVDPEVAAGDHHHAILVGDLRQRRDRSGNGEARSVSLSLRDVRGRVVRAVPPHEPFEIVVEYEATRALSNLTVSIDIEQLDGTRIATLYSGFRNESFAVPAGCGSLSCRIAGLPLRPETYSLNVFLGVNHAICDFVERAMSFDVAPADVFGTGRLPERNQGPLLTDFHWEALGSDRTPIERTTT